MATHSSSRPHPRWVIPDLQSHPIIVHQVHHQHLFLNLILFFITCLVSTHFNLIYHNDTSIYLFLKLCIDLNYLFFLKLFYFILIIYLACLYVNFAKKIHKGPFFIYYIYFVYYFKIYFYGFLSKYKVYLYTT